MTTMAARWGATSSSRGIRRKPPLRGLRASHTKGHLSSDWRSTLRPWPGWLLRKPSRKPCAYRRDGGPVEGEGWSRGVEEGYCRVPRGLCAVPVESSNLTLPPFLALTLVLNEAGKGSILKA